MTPRARFALAFGTALLIGAAALAIFWPGITMYDTVAQFAQVTGGAFDDWHPPVMARLWAVLHAASGGGTAPMLVLQVTLYAVGFGLLAGTLASVGRSVAATFVLLLAASPLLLGWQGVVLKDAQMLGASLAGFGIVAVFRSRGARVPWWAASLAGLLFLDAVLVRSNGLFAIVPLVAFLLPRPAGLPGKAAVVVAGTLAVLAITPVVNHRLLDAEATDVAKSQPLFDLAGIAAQTDGGGTGLTAAERAVVVARHCAKPFFWDPLGDEGACAAVMERLHDQPTGTLYRQLAVAAAAHPLAYAAQRLAHWNSTERWLVPAGLPSAAPPDQSEPNSEGLVTPRGAAMPQWQALAASEAGTPLGWPIVWTVVALGCAAAAWAQRREPAGGLALALSVSALGLELSFLLVSIASDLRYHLWSMTAAALALILLSDGQSARQRRLVITVGAVLIAVIGAGLIARSTLPRAPATYRAMIGA